MSYWKEEEMNRKLDEDRTRREEEQLNYPSLWSVETFKKMLNEQANINKRFLDGVNNGSD